MGLEHSEGLELLEISFTVCAHLLSSHISAKRSVSSTYHELLNHLRALSKMSSSTVGSRSSAENVARKQSVADVEMRDMSNEPISPEGQ